jgi:hypothetical protein
MKRPVKPDDEAQSKRFIDAAKKAEADETKEGAARAFKKVDPKRIVSERRAAPKKGRRS